MRTGDNVYSHISGGPEISRSIWMGTRAEVHVIFGISLAVLRSFKIVTDEEREEEYARNDAGR